MKRRVLKLRRETLRLLANEERLAVHGGFPTTTGVTILCSIGCSAGCPTLGCSAGCPVASAGC